MAQVWDPDQYLKFHGPRLRPALDLLARIPADQPETLYDLGCGPGNVTEFMRARYPAARITGVDASERMLNEARSKHPDAHWQRADLASWAPDGAADVLYSNAAFQWLDDHANLFPRLVGAVKPGGVLAIQMPRNWGAPSHVAIHEAVYEGPWAAHLTPLLRHDPVAQPRVYYDILRPHVRHLDIWETEYLQVLDGNNAVAEWTKGTALKPLLDALDGAQEQRFYTAYSAKTQALYPRQDDGKTLYPFRRLFIVAVV